MVSLIQPRRVHAIGWRAHAALITSGGIATLVAPLSRSCYADAAGELIWFGSVDAPLHPRAVLTSDASGASAHGTIRMTVVGVAAWRPPPMRLARRHDAARVLHGALTDIGEPRGFACLLAGVADTALVGEAAGTAETIGDHVTMRARPYVSAVGRACADDDAGAFADAARPLLGLGPGLTPSGDDFVGGALFARRVVVGMDAAWDAAAACIAADAAHLTHPISARLLADLAAGEGWAPLHRLAFALADRDADAVRGAARGLTMLGDTSGWNILAGFLVALSAPREYLYADAALRGDRGGAYDVPFRLARRRGRAARRDAGARTSWLEQL